jgi:hypothetical protein
MVHEKQAVPNHKGATMIGMVPTRGTLMMNAK